MYETFYGLSERPFSIFPDPSYFFMGRRHELAYAVLEYGIQDQCGFTVITGDIGCGKTTLVRRLLDEQELGLTAGLISHTHERMDELLPWVMLAFDQPYEGKSNVAMFDDLTRFLIGEYAAGNRTVLIVDEAQHLSVAALEELRMLSNINADNAQLLQLVLLGQPQLKEQLQRPELRQFAQRIVADFHIPPLAADEIEGYIRHRLAIAGREAALFTPEACALIAETSRGVPRLVNVLCDTALVYGFSADAGAIEAAVVAEVIRDKSDHGVLAFEEMHGAPPVPRRVAKT